MPLILTHITALLVEKSVLKICAGTLPLLIFRANQRT